ncbi:DEAD/DEAH box helicase [Nakamurella aerolata]|uniref:DEAD/DEAH box helicase n=1 Tax=Nakamurella aerolata TaxID=1656892 RepID=UPI0031B5D96F
MSSDTDFAGFDLPAALVDVLRRNGITQPTPIQAATLPDSLAGRDVLGRGRTGSGKTYAFLLPVLTRLAAQPHRRAPKQARALILAPTRELVSQIVAAMQPLAAALGLTHQTIFGGVGAGPQIDGMRRGVDVLVACPGRLEDLMRQGYVDLSAVQITVLDEADHMADLGFLPGVRRIMDNTPKTGQRLLFSATLDAGVDVLVKRFLSNPVTHHADPATSPVGTMRHHVLQVRTDEHLPVLVDLTSAPGRTVVFARTKHRAKKFARQLNAAGVPAVELHGNLSQGARTRNLDDFHSGAAKTLVATDIAARGIHVDDVALVIHADPPVEHKAYLHRSGRTARAGADGTVVTLMTDEQVKDVRDLTRKAGITATTTAVNPRHPLLAELAPGERARVSSAPAARTSTAAAAAASSSASASTDNTGGARSAGGRGRGAGGRGRSARGQHQADGRPATAADSDRPRRRRRSRGPAAASGQQGNSRTRGAQPADVRAGSGQRPAERGATNARRRRGAESAAPAQGRGGARSTGAHSGGARPSGARAASNRSSGGRSARTVYSSQSGAGRGR